MRSTLGTKPPGVVTVDTCYGDPQPANVDPAKRVVPGHAYSVVSVDANGNVTVQNPWGPAGGYHGGKYYPGVVTLTPEEYHRWFGQGGTVHP